MTYTCVKVLLLERKKEGKTINAKKSTLAFLGPLLKREREREKEKDVGG